MILIKTDIVIIWVNNREKQYLSKIYKYQVKILYV